MAMFNSYVELLEGNHDEVWVQNQQKVLSCHQMVYMATGKARYNVGHRELLIGL